MTLRTLNCGNYGIFLIMGHAGFCPSTVVLVLVVVPVVVVVGVVVVVVVLLPLVLLVLLVLLLLLLLLLVLLYFTIPKFQKTADLGDNLVDPAWYLCNEVMVMYSAGQRLSRASHLS